MTKARHSPIALTKQLNKAVEKPHQILRRRWYENPAFCRGFFDRCEDLALLASPRMLKVAKTAVEIAHANGDPCLVNASHGVFVHAYIACGRLFWAGWFLERCRSEFVDCCPRCQSEFFRRQGDLLGEEKKALESLEALDRCLDTGRETLSDDGRGRTLFLRGISHHNVGHRNRALADAGRALELLSLESPRGFFLDTVACIAVYIRGGDPRHDAVALEHLDFIKDRLPSDGYWKSVRTRIFWAKGHVYARLGDVRRSANQLESAHRRLLKDGLPREVVAAALDYAQLKCRFSFPRDFNVGEARRMIKACLDERDDLPSDHRKGLLEMKKVLEKSPEIAFDELGAFRQSFIAPVPGLLGERIGPE